MRAFLKKNLKFVMLGFAILFFGIAAVVWFGGQPDSDPTPDIADSQAVAATATPHALPTSLPTATPTPSVTEAPTPEATPEATPEPDGQVFVPVIDLTPEDTPAPATPAPTPQNQQAPDFTATDMAGNTVSLSSYFGKPIIINFWASWYPSSLMELPGFNDAYHRYGDKVQFLMVNLTDNIRDTESGVKAFLKDNGYDFPVLFDVNGSAFNRYLVSALPVTVMINPDGTKRSSRLGVMDSWALEGYIKEMLMDVGLD